MIKENQNLLNKFNAISDIIILFISMTFAYLIRFYMFSTDTEYIKLITYLKFAVIIIPINLIVFNFFNLYHSFRTTIFIKECIQIIKSNTILTAILLSLLFILRLVDISRFVIVIFYFVNITLIISKRFVLRRTLWKFRSKGLNLKHVIIVGAGEVANEYLETPKTGAIAEEAKFKVAPAHTGVTGVKVGAAGNALTVTVAVPVWVCEQVLAS